MHINISSQHHFPGAAAAASSSPPPREGSTGFSVRSASESDLQNYSSPVGSPPRKSCQRQGPCRRQCVSRYPNLLFGQKLPTKLQSELISKCVGFLLAQDLCFTRACFLRRGSCPVLGLNPDAIEFKPGSPASIGSSEDGQQSSSVSFAQVCSQSPAFSE